MAEDIVSVATVHDYGYCFIGFITKDIVSVAM
jgi:hypothetical protein